MQSETLPLTGPERIVPRRVAVAVQVEQLEPAKEPLHFCLTSERTVGEEFEARVSNSERVEMFMHPVESHSV